MVLTGRCICHCVEESSSEPESSSSPSESSPSESSPSESSPSESSSSPSESSLSSSSESSASSSSASSSSVSSSSASASSVSDSRSQDDSYPSISAGYSEYASITESSSSVSSSSSSSSSALTCFVPIGDQGYDNWVVYRNNVLIGSGFGTSWPEVDEGVDTSDNEATAIRPSMYNEDGDITLNMGSPGVSGGIVYPELWTHILSVTARMRARVVPFGTSPIFAQEINVAIGLDDDTQAGTLVFNVNSTAYDTYEETPTGGVSLPAEIGDIDISTWFMDETRYLEHNVEISAVEICVTGYPPLRGS